MDAPDLRRALEIFEEIAEMSAETSSETSAARPGETSAEQLARARARRLDARCQGDAALRAEVEALLRADAEAGALDTVTGGVVAALADAVAELVTPARLGAFDVLRELGRGGMGVVYEAQQREPRRRVALKTLPRISAPELDRVRDEAQAMATLLHPGIPQVYEVFEDAGRAVLVMELVRGRPLREHVRGLPRRQTVELLVKIADVVAHAHARGVVHRDLKPSNILVTDDGQPKVLDFGIAALGGVGIAGAGTLAYVAPEQLRGAPPDPRNDVYALCALAHELLLGAPPIACEGLPREALWRRKLAGPGALSTSLPPGLRDIVARGLQGAPERRFASAGELRAAWSAFLAADAIEQLVRSAAREHADMLDAMARGDAELVETCFAACRFGARQALALAPAHAAARALHDRCLHSAADWRIARREFDLAAYHLAEAFEVDAARRERLERARVEHERRLGLRQAPLFFRVGGALFACAAAFLVSLTLLGVRPGYGLFALSSALLIVIGLLGIGLTYRRRGIEGRALLHASALIVPPIMISIVDLGAWLRGWPPEQSHALALPIIACTALGVASQGDGRFALVAALNVLLWLLSARWPDAIYALLGLSAGCSSLFIIWMFNRTGPRR